MIRALERKVRDEKDIAPLVGRAHSHPPAISILGFVAPYDEAQQDRMAAFAPPTKLHFEWSRPRVYVCAWNAHETDSGYDEDCGQKYAVIFFVSNAGSHLFAVAPPGRITLFGTDGLGRDQFSRFLFGARLSFIRWTLSDCTCTAVGHGNRHSRRFLWLVRGFHLDAACRTLSCPAMDLSVVGRSRVPAASSQPGADLLPAGPDHRLPSDGRAQRVWFAE